MNTYHAFYKGKQIELQSATSLAAQQKAAALFNAKKSYQVTIVLVAVADKSVIAVVA